MLLYFFLLLFFTQFCIVSDRLNQISNIQNHTNWLFLFIHLLIKKYNSKQIIYYKETPFHVYYLNRMHVINAIKMSSSNSAHDINNVHIFENPQSL